MTISFTSLYGPKTARGTPPIPPHLSHWNPNVREYAVQYAHGLCDGYHFDSFGPPSKEQWLYLQDARQKAFHWCSVADTVGGDAQIIHMPTQQNIGRWY